MKLMLGTVQFGLAYGVTNSSGQTSREEIKKILNFCQLKQLDFIDTAFSYGESEKALGESSENLSQFKIVTKLANLEKSAMTIVDSFTQSLTNLKVKNVYGVLFHNPDDLFSKKGEEYFEQLLKFKEEQKIQKIGVSVYTPQQLSTLVDNFPIEIVQIPVNVFDQRFLENNLLKKVKESKIEVHARSIFLQGLLLEDPNKLNHFFAHIKKNIEYVREVAASLRITPLELLLSFADSIDEIDQIVVGVNNLQHLREISQSFGKKVNFDFSKFKIEDEKFILPTNWKLA